MTEYLFRVMGAPQEMRLELSKWDGGQVPTEVYRINGWHCSCPAHVPHCKHLALVKRLREEGHDLNGLTYDDVTQEVSHFIATKGIINA